MRASSGENIPLSDTATTESGIASRRRTLFPRSTLKVERSRLFIPTIAAPDDTALSASSLVWASTSASMPRDSASSL